MSFDLQKAFYGAAQELRRFRVSSGSLDVEVTASTPEAAAMAYGIRDVFHGSVTAEHVTPWAGGQSYRVTSTTSGASVVVRVTDVNA